ncbi:MAG: GntR family transcriptional regulator [Anaerolineaceae bacterium]|nr:GntR family transcriptional regulator [Anaerolineaceae bacterium]
MSHLESNETSKQKIHQQLRRSIIMGRLKPNEKLDIQSLANLYGSSVTPVREALHILEQEGLVTIKTRSGYYVAYVTLKELRDMLDLREILELAAVERAAKFITEEQLAELEHIHAGYTGDDDESYDRYTDENRNFHYTIAKASGNLEIANTLVQLLDRLARFMVLRHAGHSQDKTHARIVEALRAHDQVAACQAMLSEIVETRNVLLERLMQEHGANWEIRSINTQNDFR